MIDREKIPEILQEKLDLKPVRAPIKQETNDDGCTVLIYPKGFTRFESWLQRKLGGPKDIRRPLDDKGTIIWGMCDGEHTVLEICEVLDDKYGIEIEPVVARVWKFIAILQNLGLAFLRKPDTSENQ